MGSQSAVAAQPDAGVLRQQIEQHPSVPPLVVPLPQAVESLPAASGVTLEVASFRFLGNTRLSAAQLAAVTAPFLHRPLDFSALEAAARAVAAAYREAGWIARAYLPPQDIAQGIVSIEVVEAVFGGVSFEGNPVRGVSQELMQRYVDEAQSVGQPLNALAVDRVLLLLDDLPSVQVTGNLRQGQAKSQTDLVLRAAETSFVTGDAMLDNMGSRSTGSSRVSGNLSLNSPFERGDLLLGNVMLSEGSRYGRLGATLPVGYTGWRLGVNASAMNYRLVAPEFRALNAFGASTSLGLEANYPIWRARLNNLNLVLNYDAKSFDNMANQVSTTRYAVNTWAAGLNGNWIDTWLGGGAQYYGLTWAHGTVNLNGSPNQLIDASTTKAAGGFNKLRYSMSRTQNVSESWAIYAAIAGQWADKNLDSSEKFYLGGSNGVRAYPTSEGGGTAGKMLNVEVRQRLSQAFSWAGFYDWGQVTVNRNSGFSGAPTLNRYALQGIGAQLNWQNAAGWSAKAIWARRIGNNPNPTLAGNDQDGTLHRNRLWLQAAIMF